MKRFIVCLHTSMRTPLVGRDSATTRILKAIDEHDDADKNFLVMSITQKCSLVMLDVDSSLHESASEITSDLRRIVGDLVDDIIALAI